MEKTLRRIILEIYQRRELLKGLVVRNLKIRYKGSVLGFFWSLLDPLFMMFIYLLFIRIMRFSIDLPYLLSGIIVWQFFVMCVNDSLGAISGNTNLVKKIYFPRVILPLSQVLANLVNFLLSLAVLFVFLLFIRTDIQVAGLLILPVIVFLEAIFCLGLALAVSSISVYFRDAYHIVGVLLMAWFFMTPIIYPTSLVPERFFSLYLLNPLSSILIVFRGILFGTAMPGGPLLFVSLGFCVVLFAVGIVIFAKLEPYFADVL
ncbi:MAG: ABC transporter permease [Candidatus Theseobacter exili]|nr:ABC transporter permease [Candidatus Theseobacter exili]